MTSTNSSTKKARPNPHLWGSVFAIVASLIYGSSYIFIKNISNNHSALTIIGWRFATAFLVMEFLRLLGLIKVNFRGKPMKPLFRLVILYPVSYFLAETNGVKLTTASESGILIATIPIVTLIFSSLILKEKPTIYQLVGIGISTLGIVLTVLSQSLSAQFNLLGYAALSFAVIVYSLFAVFLIQEKLFTTVEKTYFMLASAGITFFLLASAEHLWAGSFVSFIRLPLVDREFLRAILFLAIGSSNLAFFSSNKAIELLGPSQSSTWGGLSTLVTLVSSVVVLKEHLSLFQILAAGLIVGGVYFANYGLIQAAKQQRAR